MPAQEICALHMANAQSTQQTIPTIANVNQDLLGNTALNRVNFIRTKGRKILTPIPNSLLLFRSNS